jgi:hypothetical protein
VSTNYALDGLILDTKPSDDPRVENLRWFITNLQECPADQSDEALALASSLAAQLKGLADTEMLHRACIDSL